MTRLPVRLVAAILVATALGCAGPCVMLPGGALEGAVAPAPESWAFTDDVKTIQLETRPGEPYSVNLWVIALGEHLYVHAGASRAAWVEHLEADPRARLRVGDAVYELAAARVDDQQEFDRFSDAYQRKYGRRPRNENVSEAYLFRMSAR
jgi:hypothetical protein